MIPYILPLLFATAVTVLLAMYAWQQRRVPGSRAFALLLFAVGEWALGYAFELTTPTLEGKLFWTSFNFIGIVMVPPSLTAFVLRYTRQDRWLTRRNLALLALPAAVTLLLAWTNDWHGLIRSSAGIDSSGPIAVFDPVYNYGFWAFWGYDVALSLMCLIATIRALRGSQGVYRAQFGTLLVCLLIPWIGNVIYLSGLSPFYGLDLTPFSFTIASMIIAWGMYRYRMLDVLPVARESVFEGMDDGVIVLDHRGRVADINPAAQRIAGLSTEIISQPWDQVLAQRPDLPIRLNGRDAAPVLFEVNREESCQDYEIRFSTLQDRLGLVNGHLIILHDITAQLQAETELRRAKESAESANRAKSTFLANMSHELRTPLNAILGYSEMMTEDAEAAHQQNLARDAQKIYAAGRHLLTLINDILDLSKIEAGKMQVFLETFDLLALIQDVLAMTQPMVEGNGNRLQVTLAPDLGGMHSDQTKVRQILFNLLSNAAKFTSNGEISLAVSTEDSPPRIVLRVSDSGIGMAAGQVERLFQPFIQADSSTTRRFGGTGLGLAITRSFCQMLNGEISVESRLGAGSTFVVRLPLDSREGSAAEGSTAVLDEMDHPGQVGPAQASVLVIDDDPSARELMERYLVKEGYQVTCASTGEEGLRLAKSQMPNVITLDVLMPGLDGWGVLVRLKADPATHDIPVIMLTMVEEPDHGYALGVSEYLIKPIDRLRLLAVLQRYCRIDECPILIVEDEAQTREMLRRILEKEGWRIVEAENGRAGLQRLSEEPPQLILLDLMMPEMDGFEFVDEMRKRPDWRAIPIVVVTAKEITPEDRRRLNGYVEKIILKGSHTRQELLAEVRARVSESAKQ